MSKMLSVLVAIFALSIVALPGPVDAAQRRADGIRNLDQYEFSSARRQRRVVRRYVGPRYYSQPYYYGPYGYQPYGYTSPMATTRRRRCRFRSFRSFRSSGSDGEHKDQRLAAWRAF